MSVVIYMRRYISRRKLLHKMKEVCGAISHKMDELSEKTSSSGWNPAFNLYLHTCIYFAILSLE